MAVWLLVCVCVMCVCVCVAVGVCVCDVCVCVCVAVGVCVCEEMHLRAIAHVCVQGYLCTCAVAVMHNACCVFRLLAFLLSLSPPPPQDCRKRNLIPILFKECTLPNFLRDTYYLDYQRYAKLDDKDRVNDHFWHRLVKAV